MSENSVPFVNEIDLSVIEGALSKIKDEDILLSRKNCNCYDLSSIVLSNNKGKLTRLMLAWPGHKLDKWWVTNAFPLGIHTHLYKFKVELLVGDVTYKTWEKLDPGCHGHSFFQYHYVNGTMKFVSKDSELQVVGSFKLKNTPNREVELQARLPHSFDVNGPSAWIITEDERVTDEMDIYTEYPVPPIPPRPIQFNTPEDVKTHVYGFFALLNNLDGLDSPTEEMS